ncbi:MAG: hypothetical protein FWF46_09475 [Oscillospiraceae bacterium]|nr:hypothetical protein [Oscillospiraceae bacterium]
MQLIVNVPNDIKDLERNMAKFKSMLIKKNIENKCIDNEQKEKVHCGVLNYFQKRADCLK